MQDTDQYCGNIERMMKSDILTSANLIYNNTQTIVTQNGVRIIIPNPYNDGGCGGANNCKGYYIGVPCLIELYQGITACQFLYLMDGSGNPVDLTRLEYMNMNIYNEYECEVLAFSSEDETSDGGIDFLQDNGIAELLNINPKNFHDFDDYYFSLSNVRVLDADAEKICPDEKTAIVLGEQNEFGTFAGSIIFNPLKFVGTMRINITEAEGNEGSCVVRFNGMPHPVEFGKDIELIDLAESENAIIEVTSFDVDSIPTIAEVYSIVVSDESVVSDTGKFKVCYSGNKTVSMIPSFLTATVEIKFKDDDPIEHGATHVISCVRLGTLKRYRSSIYSKPVVFHSGDTADIAIELKEPLGDNIMKLGLYDVSENAALETYYPNGDKIIRVDDKHYTLKLQYEDTIGLEGEYTLRMSLYTPTMEVVSAGEDVINITWVHDVVNDTLER